ncbi:MAG TPA: ComEC/Rec2 family competence protein, partial [Candidatus Saccharimonadales bacterium]|nr:ComEC/Rec2 family competence protein [Candidatus Saccharimonadales bacterium]
FNRITPGAMGANLVAAPLVGAGLVASIAAVPAGLVSPLLAAFRADIDPDLDAGALLAHVAALCFDGAEAASRVVSALPAMSYLVPTPPAWSVLLVIGSGAIALSLPAGDRARRILLGAALLALAWIALPIERGEARATGALRVTVFDVGQGSSTLVRTPEGRRILFDAGGFARSRFDPGRRVVARALLTMGMLEVDAVAITHADFDHSGGMAAILRLFPGREIWVAEPAVRDRRIARLVTRARAQGRSVRLMQAGSDFGFGGARIRCLHPPGGWTGTVTNERSMAVEISAGGRSLLVTGDSGSVSERVMRGRLAPVDLLLVPHHGSRTSSSVPFLRALRPAWALISCGFRNRYGHPAPETAGHLRAAGARILRTDLQGALRVTLPPGAGAPAIVETWRDGRWRALEGLSPGPGRDSERRREAEGFRRLPPRAGGAGRSAAPRR